MMSVTHIGFSDETTSSCGNYHGLGFVSVQQPNASKFRKEIRGILTESGVSKEMKWNEIGGAKYRFAAIKLIDWSIGKVLEGSLKIDVLMWSHTDSRHNKVKNRDNDANRMRMYFHLSKHVLAKRWGQQSVWWIVPDRLGTADWTTLHSCLQAKSFDPLAGKFDFSNDVSMFDFGSQLFEIETVYEEDSQNVELIQLADLFAGMGICSGAEYNDFSQWKESVSNQASLFGDATSKASKRKKEGQYPVIDYFYTQAKNNSLGVSFATERRFRTPKPSNPINYWWWQPQGLHDRAPTKSL